MYEAKDYETRVWWSSEDNAFVAQVTEFPGIMAHGETRMEAFDSIQVALDGALTWKRELGETVPAPIHVQAAA